MGALTGSPSYFPLNNNSPALGAGDATHCATRDQRGETRPQPAGTICDIGAYEHTTLPLPPTDTPTPSLTPTEAPPPTATNRPANVTLNGTACNFVDAISAAQSNAASGECPAGNVDTSTDTIVLTENITLSATVRIRSNITINGGGYHISGNNAVRIFRTTSAEANLVLNNITIRDANAGTSIGGALYHLNGEVTIENSAFLNNHAREGGAIWNNVRPLTIRNSTFSGNSAALELNCNNCTEDITLSHVTIAGNTGSIAAVKVTTDGDIEFINSIIADNTVNLNCTDTGAPVYVNTLVESTVGSCGSPTFTSDPALGTIAGSPSYYPLLDTSPALGAGDATHCTATDQRGETRPQPAGTICDIGAYEHTTLPLLPTDTPTPSMTPSLTRSLTR